MDTVDNPFFGWSAAIFCPHWLGTQPVEKLRLLWTQQCFPTGQLGCPQVVPSCVPRFRGSSPQPHRQHCVAAFTRAGEMQIDVVELGTSLWRTVENLGTTGLLLGTERGQLRRRVDGPSVLHSLWTTVAHNYTGG